ncbi:MAG: hypothetical protein K6B65_05950 [Bacilli bacterium]|nr:hypothetical protein [Bacilli bacterium]
MEFTNEDYIYNCLASAYMQLIAVKEKEEITVNEVCRKAGVSRSGFYRLMGKKDYKQELFLYHGFAIGGVYFRIREDEAMAIKDLYRFLYRYQSYADIGVKKDESSFLSFLYLASKMVGGGGFHFLSLYPYIKTMVEEGFSKSEEEYLAIALDRLGLK